MVRSAKTKPVPAPEAACARMGNSVEELRLMQQFLFVSCALQDMIRIFLQREKDLRRFHGKDVQLHEPHASVGGSGKMARFTFPKPAARHLEIT